MKIFKILMLTAALCFIQSAVQAQVAIGKQSLDGSSILDFGSEPLGIILPYVTGEADVVGAVPGTLIFDAADQKVKYRSNTAWVDMSRNSGTVDTSGQDALTEVTTGAIIGSTTSAAPGVLVLESTTKALLLPRVSDPMTTMLSPEPGTIVYDTNSKKICVYNGQQWAFWGE